MPPRPPPPDPLLRHDVENLDSGRRLLSTVKFILVSLFSEVNAGYLTVRGYAWD